MKLKNYTLCNNILSQTRGLMFSTRKTLVFVFNKEKYVPLHTWFVFFPITVLYLDERKKIVEQTVMKPFRFYSPQNKAKYVVEIPHEVKTRIKNLQFYTKEPQFL